MGSLPLLLVVDRDPCRRAFVREHLAPLGWTVAEAADGDAALAAIASLPVSLVLLHIQTPDDLAIARLIRARAGPHPPILAAAAPGCADLADSARAAGVDDIIVRPRSAEALIEAIRAWQPIEVSLDRLAAVFGAERLDGLLAHFRRQLADALDQLDGGDAGLAHRIGGLAGTLGFARVSSTWLAASEGNESTAPAARESARVALDAIDRRLRPR